MLELFYKFMDDDALLQLSQRIKEKEKSTSGEIVVSIKCKRDLLTRKSLLRDLAIREFRRLKLTETRDRTGVMIYLILKSREFYILADEGINSLVPENTWDNLKNEMVSFFKQGEFTNGLLHALDSIGEKLSAHFPIKPDDTNEISNMVIVRE